MVGILDVQMVVLLTDTATVVPLYVTPKYVNGLVVKAVPLNMVVPEKFVIVMGETTPEPEALRMPAVIEYANVFEVLHNCRVNEPASV
jgi:hypothetical protein